MTGIPSLGRRQDSVEKWRELFSETRLATYLNDFLSFEMPGDPSAGFERS